MRLVVIDPQYTKLDETYEAKNKAFLIQINLSFSGSYWAINSRTAQSLNEQSCLALERRTGPKYPESKWQNIAIVQNFVILLDYQSYIFPANFYVLKQKYSISFSKNTKIFLKGKTA